MPVLAKFYGIVIRMLWARALGARFHAFYENWELVIGIGPVRVLGGDAPHWVREKVMSWALMHEDDLRNDWELCAHRRPPLAIGPWQ